MSKTESTRYIRNDNQRKSNNRRYIRADEIEAACIAGTNRRILHNWRTFGVGTPFTKCGNRNRRASGPAGNSTIVPV
jgi:hypothetical protein